MFIDIWEAPAVVFAMNQFSEKRICCNTWRKQPGNEDSSGTHKKEKWHLFLGERVEPGFLG
jgi:hypothetical protein